MPSDVQVHRESLTLPTYAPEAPDRNPMFLERRVYQGSSGKVYPLPFIDRVAERASPQRWDVVRLENAFLSVLLLPALGGRIHAARDKTNGYDFIYRQEVIKPALVGLAGPWVSGGIEFNWPQHHRPSTFMPAQVEIERAPDGSVTAWLGEYEPMNRMKGMHGVCLHPERSVIELKVRLYNRTPHRQTFLWWVNLATRVHERYQSFFPPDVTAVADHAKRAMSRFPRATGTYYGVDYGARARRGIPSAEQPPHYRPTGEAAPDDLSWYCNIPVPTSFMALGTREPFFGGYDHAREAGLIHVANPHLSPGKKQWTWGNHPFGYAWDRNLTDATADGEWPPYIELMAGVFTDNQPDFSFLHPGETRTWSQFLYPIQRIGPAHKADVEGALSLRVEGGRARIGVAVTRRHASTTTVVEVKGRRLAAFRRALSPAAPLVEELRLPRGMKPADVTLRLLAGDRELLRYTPATPRSAPLPAAATEPPAPAAVNGTDELFLTGLHLEQYRHATRPPEAYWREALRRDRGDSRCRSALGQWHLRRGEFSRAVEHLRAAFARLTARNPNPSSGEVPYHLGLALRFEADREIARKEVPLARFAGWDEAYAAFYKATWNHDWQSAACYELARIDCLRRDWNAAAVHTAWAVRTNGGHENAHVLRALVLRRLGEAATAERILNDLLARDPLHAWARHAAGRTWNSDTQTRLDVALDYAGAGFVTEALDCLPAVTADQTAADGTVPLVAYCRAWLLGLAGNRRGRLAALRRARKAPLDYCFPARLEEIVILEGAIRSAPDDAAARYLLGNLFYDRRRHTEAIALWQASTRLAPAFATAWRNLGIAYFNVRRDGRRARRAYERAVAASPDDARLVYERDQLWKRLGEPVERRFRALAAADRLVRRRDDLTLEWCSLLNHRGEHETARALLASRRFQPWEGGEGLALGQHVRTHLALARRALVAGDAATALDHARQAGASPENLGEAKHLLANQSDVWLAQGDALAALDRSDEAREAWREAASQAGDFQGMSVRPFSEVTYFSALALRRLGRAREAGKLLRALRRYATELARRPARIDYFATSLPTLLLFNDDLQARQVLTARFLMAQAACGLGEASRARTLLASVLKRDPSHALAQELWRELTAATGRRRP